MAVSAHAFIMTKWLSKKVILTFQKTTVLSTLLSILSTLYDIILNYEFPA